MILNNLIFIAYQAVGVLSMPSLKSLAEEECGVLGVMEWNWEELPADVDRSNLRKCKEHPIELTTPNKRDTSLTERACLPDPTAEYQGCDNGYCWSSCQGGGKWCWLAYNGGYGDWVKCNGDPGSCFNIKYGCGHGSCSACGCSC